MYLPWGYHLCLDLYEVNHKKIIKEEFVREYVRTIIKKIGMKAHGDCHCERFGEAHLNGISAMQFIETSSITVHCDEVGDRVFVDIFSCQDFDKNEALDYSFEFFGTQEYKIHYFER